MIKLTFKQYLESKEQLRKAIDNTPVSIVEYEVKKYCSLAVGESEDKKQLIGLRPKYKIIVEWQYVDMENPTPTSIQIASDDSAATHATFWSGTKLSTWLSRHATRKE